MNPKLNFFYQNTRGLRGKIIHNLKQNITLANFDCISLTETWLNGNFESSEIFDETYNVFRADRSVEKYNTLKVNRPDLSHDTNVVGGGCLIALKRHISAIRMTKWEDEIPFNNVWLKLNTHGSSKIFINTVYLPGWASFEHMKLYYEHLFDIINIREPYARYIILGDFNIPSIDWFHDGNYCLPVRFEGRVANELVNMMITTNLRQRNPVKNNFNRTLDLILSNMDFTAQRATEITREDEYQNSLRFNLDKSDIKFLKSTKTPKYNFFKTNYDEFNEDLSRINWNLELDCLHVDLAVNKFYKIMKQLIT